MNEDVVENDELYTPFLLMSSGAYFFQAAENWRQARGLTQFAACARAARAHWAHFLQLKELYLAKRQNAKAYTATYFVSTACKIQSELVQVDEDSIYQLFDIHLRASSEVEVMYLGFIAVSLSVYHICKILLSILPTPLDVPLAQIAEANSSAMDLFAHFRSIEQHMNRFELWIARGGRSTVGDDVHAMEALEEMRHSGKDLCFS